MKAYAAVLFILVVALFATQVGSAQVPAPSVSVTNAQCSASTQFPPFESSLGLTFADFPAGTQVSVQATWIINNGQPFTVNFTFVGAFTRTFRDVGIPAGVYSSTINGFYQIAGSPQVPFSLASQVTCGTVSSAGRPARFGYCLNGRFTNLEFGQPAVDPAYRGATPAFYFEGKGITCDNPAGYVFTGQLVDTLGHDSGPNDPGRLYMYARRA